MADIFISYASEDRDRIMPVVRSLEAHGWSVWWDRIIPPGKTFARVIEEALGAARCLIVLWTHASVRSDWVANEAAEGARRRVLIPALLDEVEIPFEFKRIQAASLVDWEGESDHAGFQQLVKALTDLLGPPDAESAGPDAPEAPPAEPVPPATPAAAVARPRPEFTGSEPAVTKPHGKRATSRIVRWAAPALLIAGAVALFKAGMFQPTRVPPEDSASKPGIEAAARPDRSDPPSAAPSAAGEGAPETPPASTESSAPADKQGAEEAGSVASPEPMPEATAPAVETSPPPARTESSTTAPAAAKEPTPNVPAPDLSASPPPPQPKPRRQKPPPPAARAAAPALPAADPIAPAPRVKPDEVPPAAAGPRDASPRKKFTNGVGMEFVLISASAGAFTMGSRLGIEELIRRFGGTEAVYRNEKPFRSVVIERPFYLMTTPVTQGQWRQVMGEYPSSFRDCGEDCPVEMVSWDDAQRFIGRLNQMESRAGYRLPSEAEWEYAARAGSGSEFFFGNDAGKLAEFAWHSANSENRPHPVGRKKPNPWGLYDMAGNVWEWVEDDWHAGYDGAPADGSAWTDAPRASARVVRGGGWGVAARYCRSAARYHGSPAARTSHVGLRLVRSVSPGS